MAYTLHTDAGNFRSFKVLIAAEYSGVDIKIEDATAPPAGSLVKKLPILEVNGTSISNSNAITRFVGNDIAT